MDTTTASLEQPAVRIDARGILAEAGTDIRSLSTAALGRLGEEIAARYLRSRGIRVIDRNVRLQRAEIDLVALDGDTLVIIEVKTRRTLITGVPQAAVTGQKLRRLRKLTGLYLAEHSPPHRDVRIDVVAVLAHADGTLQLEHLQGVGA